MNFDMIGRFFHRLSTDSRLLGEEFQNADAAATQAADAIGKNDLMAAVVNGDKAAMRKALSDVNVDTSQPDMWNRGDSGMRMHNIASGPAERASGGGAPKMVREYSDTAAQSALVTAYDSLSRRMDSMEKAIAAIAAHVAKAAGESFPSDAGGHNGGGERHGDDEDDRKKDGEDNSADSDVEKALRGEATMIHSIPSFMAALGSKSRHPNIVTPPSFVKANTGNGRTRSFDDDVTDALDHGNLSDAEAIAASTLRQALAHHRAGVLSADQFTIIKNRTPSHVREMLLGEAA
ncbi:MAG TPA: hypothetical protein VFL96_16130 [Acidobacteriaceae bacterium]|jgi:hypothetical protein|nr:hypothetical protein [Acidobacteriaceae bacterium]